MDISCGMVENEKKSKKGKIKKIDGRLLLVLVARVVVNCGIWHIVVEVFFLSFTSSFGRLLRPSFF